MWDTVNCSMQIMFTTHAHMTTDKFLILQYYTYINWPACMIISCVMLFDRVYIKHIIFQYPADQLSILCIFVINIRSNNKLHKMECWSRSQVAQGQCNGETRGTRAALAYLVQSTVKCNGEKAQSKMVSLEHVYPVTKKNNNAGEGLFLNFSLRLS